MDEGNSQSEVDDVERREHLIHDYLNKCVIDENVDISSVKVASYF